MGEPPLGVREDGTGCLCREPRGGVGAPVQEGTGEDSKVCGQVVFGNMLDQTL